MFSLSFGDSRRPQALTAPNQSPAPAREEARKNSRRDRDVFFREGLELFTRVNVAGGGLGDKSLAGKSKGTRRQGSEFLTGGSRESGERKKYVQSKFTTIHDVVVRNKSLRKRTNH
jgi:hypothetical protein